MFVTDLLTQPLPASMGSVILYVTLATLCVEMHVVHLVANAPAEQDACAKLEVSATLVSSVSMEPVLLAATLASCVARGTHAPAALRVSTRQRKTPTHAFREDPGLRVRKRTNDAQLPNAAPTKRARRGLLALQSRSLVPPKHHPPQCPKIKTSRLSSRWSVSFSGASSIHDGNVPSKHLMSIPSLAVFAATGSRLGTGTDMTEKFFCRVDVSDEFPFLVTKLSPYYDG
jgi:hypothetical protein